MNRQQPKPTFLLSRIDILERKLSRISDDMEHIKSQNRKLMEEKDIFSEYIKIKEPEPEQESYWFWGSTGKN